MCRRSSPSRGTRASSTRASSVRWMGKVMTADDLPELRDDQAEASAVRGRATRPRHSSATSNSSSAPAASCPLIRRLFCRHLEVTAGTSIGPGVLGAIAEAMGDPSIRAEAHHRHRRCRLGRAEPRDVGAVASAERVAGVHRGLRRLRARVRQPWSERVGHPQRHWETKPDARARADRSDAPRRRRRLARGTQREERRAARGDHEPRSGRRSPINRRRSPPSRPDCAARTSTWRAASARRRTSSR